MDVVRQPTQGWIEVSADGRFLYTANSASNSLSVYALDDAGLGATALNPVEIQVLQLGGPQAPNPVPGPSGFDVVPYQLTLDPTGDRKSVV